MQSYRRWLWFRCKHVTPTEFWGSRQFAKQWCDQILPSQKQTPATGKSGLATAHTSHVDTGPGLTNGSTVMDQLIRSTSYRREPWNKGKLVGQKAPLKLKDIWAIRVRLQLGERARELALFNLAIDSKLRSCDLVKLRVRDVTHGDRIAARAIVMQQKTQRPVQFEITEQTRESLGAWIRRAGLKADDYLFPSRLRASPHVSTRQYARIVRSWGARSGSIQLPMVRTRCAAPRPP
jgi:integrase